MRARIMQRHTRAEMASLVEILPLPLASVAALRLLIACGSKCSITLVDSMLLVNGINFNTHLSGRRAVLKPHRVGAAPGLTVQSSISKGSTGWVEDKADLSWIASHEAPGTSMFSPVLMARARASQFFVRKASPVPSKTEWCFVIQRTKPPRTNFYCAPNALAGILIAKPLNPVANTSASKHWRGKRCEG